MTSSLFWFALAAGTGGGEPGGGGSVFHAPHVFALEGTLFEINGMIITQWAIIAVLAVLAILAGRSVQKIPRGLQSVFEALFEFLEGWLAGFMGGRHEARRFLPLLGSFFIFILVSNYSGLLPGAGKFEAFFPPTPRWGTTLGLALIVMISCQVIAIREHGVGGYLHNFLGPSPGLMSLLMTPLTVLEEFVRPFSLSLRLFGNIFAEEVLLGIVVSMAAFLIPIPIMGLSLLFGALQAIVFTTLSAIYIGGAVHGHH